MFSLAFTAGLLASSFFSAATALPATRQVRANGEVVAYYTQGASQTPLRTYCDDDSVSIIPIGFVIEFPNSGSVYDAGFPYPFTSAIDQCAGYSPNSNGDAYCPSLAADVAYCQAKGKKILVSLGGDSQVYLQNDQAGIDFANFLWAVFGFRDCNNHGQRPFGDVYIDGFDFDIETTSSPVALSTGYGAMARQLRSLMDAETTKQYYLTAAPQCVVPDAHISDALSKARFDYVFTQFYNTKDCSARAYFNHSFTYGNYQGDISFTAWADWLRANSPSTPPKLLIGLPASQTASSDPNYYLQLSEVNTLIQAFQTDALFGGIMLFDLIYSGNNQINGQSYAANVRTLLNQNSNYAEPVLPYTTPNPLSFCRIVTSPYNSLPTSTTTYSSTAVIVTSPYSSSSTTTVDNTSTTVVITSPYYSGPTESVLDPGPTSITPSTTSTNAYFSPVFVTSTPPSTILSVQPQISCMSGTTCSMSLFFGSSNTGQFGTIPIYISTTGTSDSPVFVASTSFSVSPTGGLDGGTVSSTTTGPTSPGFTIGPILTPLGTAPGTDVGPISTNTGSTTGMTPTTTTVSEYLYTSSSTTTSSTTTSNGFFDVDPHSTSLTSTTVASSMAPILVRPSPVTTSLSSGWSSASMSYSWTYLSGGIITTSIAAGQTVTTAPTSTWADWSEDPSVTVTTIVTNYVNICPTGLTTVPYTLTTKVPVSATSSYIWPTGKYGCPEGFYTTVTVCTVCAAAPTTLTLTLPAVTSTIKLTAVNGKPTGSSSRASVPAKSTDNIGDHPLYIVNPIGTAVSSVIPAKTITLSGKVTEQLTTKTASASAGWSAAGASKDNGDAYTTDAGTVSKVITVTRIGSSAVASGHAQTTTSASTGASGDLSTVDQPSNIKTYTGGAGSALDELPGTVFGVAVCVVVAIAGLIF